MTYYIGMDIGSTCTKTAVLDEEKEICDLIVKPTGWSSVDTAEGLKQELEEKGYLAGGTRLVSTGYGRASVAFADKNVTEITCHARGAGFIHQTDDLIVIDIGGQDTKLILLENGMVSDFMMNDKCSAGTGRFLEVMANTLGVNIDQLCDLASKGGGVAISSMCTVFAESEVISLIGRGERKENIAFGIIESIVQKVATQATRWQLNRHDVCLTGGLYRFDYIRARLSEKLGVPVSTHEAGHFAGAIGAALSAYTI